MWNLGSLREKLWLRVLGNMVLRKIFGNKRVKVTGEWRRLHNEELQDLCWSPNTVWVLKSRRMRWVWHEACRGKGVVDIGFWWENLRGRDHWEDLGIDGRKILKWMMKEMGCRTIALIGLTEDRDRWQAVVNTVIEPSGSVKCGEFLNYLRTC